MSMNCEVSASDSAAIAAQRAAEIATTVERVRALARGEQDIGVAAAQCIGVLMQALAEQPALWRDADFPVPQDKLWQAYALHEDADGSYAMYAVAMKPGHQQPPHNHTTWAVIAGVRGREKNALYARHAQEPAARVEHLADITVGQGNVLALGPDDIHAIEVLGPQNALHLHLYGKGFANLSDRRIFDLATGASRPFPIIQNVN